MTDDKNRVLRKLTTLKPHPRQTELIGTANDEAIRDRAAEIEARGLDRPVQILPAGIIVGAYLDWLACGLLGFEEVPVVINHELAKQDPTTVERSVIKDLVHSTFHPFLRARCFLRLLELDRGMSPLRLFSIVSRLKPCILCVYRQ